MNTSPSVTAAKAIKAAAQEAFDRINAMPVLDDAKRLLLARSWLTYDARMDVLRREQKVTEKGRDVVAQRAVLGADDLRPAGDDTGAFVIAYRDAQQRAEQLDNATAALRLLDRALNSGDDLLARAIAAHSFGRGWSDVTSSYTDVHPEYEAKMDAARAAGMSSGLGLAVVFSVPRPDLLRGLSTHKVELLVENGAADLSRFEASMQHLG